MKRTDLDPDLRLIEEAVEETVSGAEAGILHEENVSALLPARGGSPIREDGTVKIVVIRPCVSRGKRVRGLPPIYTPEMLKEHAHIFSGWPMFMDHVTEEMQEALRKRGRSVTELGGRIVESWWDGSFSHPEDSKFGFETGAVMAYALPQPGARAMIEADAEILRCSINAWPTGARRGKAAWNGKEGMVIEGISEEPPGSVDWVIRAGAGGRVLQEAESFAASILESAYSADHDQPTEGTMKDFSEMSPDQIRDYLRENHPDVLEAPQAPAPQAGVLTEEQVANLLTEQRESILGEFKTLLEEHEASEDERVQEEIERRDTARSLETKAHKLIEAAEGLTPGWKAELKAKYVVLPSGPSRALQLLEADEDGTLEEKLHDSVEADVERALELIRETTPEPRPTGLGGSVQEGEETGQPRIPARGENEFIDYLVESGLAESPEEAVTKMREVTS